MDKNCIKSWIKIKNLKKIVDKNCFSITTKRFNIYRKFDNENH